jgi:hypothetical protein
VLEYHLSQETLVVTERLVSTDVRDVLFDENRTDVLVLPFHGTRRASVEKR